MGKPLHPYELQVQRSFDKQHKYRTQTIYNAITIEAYRDACLHRNNVPDVVTWPSFALPSRYIELFGSCSNITGPVVFS